MAITDKINAIADAIREKTGKEDKMTLAQMPGEIAGITTIPDMNNPADAMDVAYGKAFIGEDGVVDIGKLPFTTGLIGENRVPSYSEEDNGISMQMRFIERMIVEPDSVVKLIADASKFGNATANQVTKGSTFTSAAGLLVEGTMEPSSGGMTLPDLNNPAAASDVAYGKEFIGEDGTVVAGELRPSSFMIDTSIVPSYSKASAEISLKSTNTGRKILEDGAEIEFSADASEFGNATANQVAKGSTFTSAAGLLVEGTMEPSSGGMTLPDLNNPAAASDVAYGREFIGEDGTVVAGELRPSSFMIDTSIIPSYSKASAEISLKSTNTGRKILEDGAEIEFSADASEFGNASAGQVLRGTTFTSSAGLKVEGTLVPDNGVELPELDNPGRAEDMVSGKQLIDADGNVVTGTIEHGRGYFFPVDGVTAFTEDGAVGFNQTFTKDALYRAGDTIQLFYVDLGDAAAEDVVMGKTFTSEEGLKIEGTVKKTNVIQHMQNVTVFEDDDGINFQAVEENAKFLSKGSYINLASPLSTFGSARAEDVAKGVTFTSAAGFKVEGGMERLGTPLEENNPTFEIDGEGDFGIRFKLDKPKYLDGDVYLYHSAYDLFGTATPDQVAQGVTFTSRDGLKIEGTALIPGGGFVYPEGAFVPVSNFTDGKQYALVAVIDGVCRYINTTTYNNYTMNATVTTIAETVDDYVVFSENPVLFTAVASGDGFLLQNGTNYLHGTSSGGTALRVGTTQAVWTVDASETAGFSEGKYYEKENADAVWLINNTGGYNWSVKYETAGSFGYDRNGRDSTYSTGFVSFVLYEYVAGEGGINPVVDSSDANVTADKMLAGYSGYAKGNKIEGNIQLQTKTATANGTVTADPGHLLTSVTINVPTGGSGGLSIKSGTTSSAAVETGFSDLEEFFLYKESQNATGLIHLHYSKTEGTSCLYASAWSTSAYGTKTITNAATAPTISGGSITIPGSTPDTGGLSSGVTYKWVAVGTE